jgi:hypothetical protein
VKYRETFILSILVLFVAVIHAQPAIQANDAYGLDPLLYNGKFYTYNYPSSVKGTPFFNGLTFVQGSVQLRGVLYKNIPLKYDVVNQELVLQNKYAAAGEQHIVISEAWLESFNLEDKHFELIATGDTTKSIFQSLGTGPVKILYAWSKEKKIDTQIGAKNFQFTPLTKKLFLLKNEIPVRYKNNKSFIALFDPSIQTTIRNYIRQKHVNVRRSPDPVMTQLITFCNSLIQK